MSRRVLVALLLAIPVLASAGPEGSPDPGFGGSGRVLTGGGRVGSDQIRAIVPQPDGKLLVAGSSSRGGNFFSFIVARYLANGSLDPSFNGGFSPYIAIPGDGAWGLELQPNGYAVAVGSGGPDGVDFELVRYDPVGQIDLTFGVGGRVSTDMAGLNDAAHAVAMQFDGKVVAAGYATLGPSDRRYALARYELNGALDVTFGSGGRVIGPGGGSDPTTFEAVAILPDQKILAASTAVMRFQTDGTLDTTFGTGGIAPGAGDAMVVQPDGYILVAKGDLGSPTVRRLDPDGNLDTSFGGGSGAVTIAFPGAGDATSGLRTALALGPDGRIFVAGRQTAPLAEGFGVARLLPDGTLDGTFGTNGLAISLFGHHASSVVALASEPDGGVVVGGGAGSSERLAIARYFGGVCGNGVTEAGEECDDGNLAPGDGCDPNCCVHDTDGDGACDTNDPCTGPMHASAAKILISRYQGLLGDDTLTLVADITFPFPFSPSLDPVAKGARLLLRSATGVVLDVPAPPGAYAGSSSYLPGRGWKVNAAETKWTYIDRSDDPPAGVITFVIQDRSPRSPGLVRVTVKGKRGFYSWFGADLPLSAEIVVDAPTAETGQCASLTFPGPPPAPSCIADTPGSHLRCI